MKILAIETSAVSASAACCEDGKLLAQSFQNNGLTHSVTLMPMIDEMLKNAGISLADAELIAVAAGPGSFTGLRIGISTAKGLAFAQSKPCAGVSTLEAMAYNAGLFDGLIVCAMDARRSQVYNALFESRDGALTRRCGDRAVALPALMEELKTCPEPKLIVGDGALLCYNSCVAAGIDGVRLAPENLRMQSAWGVARAAEEQARRGELTDGVGLRPVYHRLSQAERERLAREKAQNKTHTK